VTRTTPPTSDVRLDDLGPLVRRSVVEADGRIGSAEVVEARPLPADSGVRLVPMGDDEVVPGFDEATLADQPIGLPSDGPAQHEPPSRPADNTLQTEEMDLGADEERREARKKRAEAAAKSSSRLNAPAPKTPRTPKPSPFELSDDDVQAAERKHTDFELPPPAEGEDFSLELTDDSLDFGAEPEQTGAPASGINLGKPIDKGISLESDEGSSDFDLTLDDAPSHKTPKPSRGKLPVAARRERIRAHPRLRRRRQKER